MRAPTFALLLVSASSCAPPPRDSSHTQAPPAVPTSTDAVPAAPTATAETQANANGSWSKAGTSEINLGELDCYSQEALDECAARAQPAPSGQCAPPGRTQTVVTGAGMNCSECFTDCYCRGTVATFSCQ